MCSFTDSVIQTFPHSSWKYLSHRTCSLDKHRAGQGIPADEGGFSSFSSRLCLSGAVVAFVEVKTAHFTVEITAQSSKKEHTGTTLKGTAPGALSTPPPLSGRCRTSGPVGKTWHLFFWKPQTRVRPLPEGISLPRDPFSQKPYTNLGSASKVQLFPSVSRTQDAVSQNNSKPEGGKISATREITKWKSVFKTGNAGGVVR